MKNWKFFCAMLLMATLVFCGCDRGMDPTKSRQAFVGDYTFVSTGNIDLYMGAVMVFTVPMDKEGEFSISLAEKSNAVWIVAEGDSLLASVSGNELFMEPTKEETTMAGVEMKMSFTYGKATLENNRLSWTSDVDITATYQSVSIAGKGQVDFVATKK